MISTLLLLLGLGLILVGANILTDGASAIAKRMNVSDLVVGLTIVAFGTSAPEMVVSLMSSVNGSAGIALGNVLGSNLFNVLMIVGVTAVIVPISVDHSSLTRGIPFVLMASLALFFVAADVWIDGAETSVITRTEGAVFMLFFAVFMYYTFSLAKKNVDEVTEQTVVMPVWRSVVWIVGGLAALVYGGNMFVDAASEIALSLGVSESVVGLTIVSGGTSLPELATSIVAALKKKPDMAVGNVIGSCVFNIFLILGASALVSPLAADSFSLLDFVTLAVSAAMLWIFAFAYRVRTITRIEGSVMVMMYVAYISYLVIQC